MHHTIVKSMRLFLFSNIIDEIFKCLHTDVFDFIIFRSFGLNLGKPFQNVTIFTQVVVHKLQEEKY